MICWECSKKIKWQPEHINKIREYDVRRRYQGGNNNYGVLKVQKNKDTQDNYKKKLKDIKEQKETKTWSNWGLLKKKSKKKQTIEIPMTNKKID